MPLRILVTNDDGIRAPGLAVLEGIARTLSSDVHTVAPENEQSGASHSLTLHSPLRIIPYGNNRYSVTGTPTDCVALAVKEILKDQKPTLILSGLNAGSNLGEDVTYSGTVAAAMEGTLLDIPSIAISQAYAENKANIRWDAAQEFLPQLLQDLMENGIPAHTLVNINIPALPASEIRGIKIAPQGKRKLGDNITRRIDPEGRPYYWIGSARNEDKEHPDSDLAAIRNGHIAVTPLYLDLTHHALLQPFAKRFTCNFTKDSYAKQHTP